MTTKPVKPTVEDGDADERRVYSGRRFDNHF
jgi:hypothetical protein